MDFDKLLQENETKRAATAQENRQLEMLANQRIEDLQANAMNALRSALGGLSGVQNIGAMNTGLPPLPKNGLHLRGIAMSARSVSGTLEFHFVSRVRCGALTMNSLYLSVTN